MFPGFAEYRDQKETEDKTFFRRSQELRKGGKMSGLLKAISSITIVFFMLISLPVVVLAENYRTAAVAAEVLNLRQNPTVSAMILSKLPKGVQVLITGERDGWYKVMVPVNGEELTGWVMGQYISIDSNKEQEPADQNASTQKDSVQGSGTGQATTQQSVKQGTINLVNASVLGATKINKINAGTINVLSESTVFSIRTGTISVISVNQGGADTTGSNPTDAGDAGIGPAGSSPDAIGPDAEELIRFAKSLLGTPYAYGGTSPSGFDCSGFTSYVFGAFGIKLERVSTDQAKQGMEISKENLKPGDLVFFDTNGGHSVINHTGIFIGDGKFIHASSGTSSCVIISDLTTGYYAGNFMTARRIYQLP